jgi:hypothetical protein
MHQSLSSCGICMHVATTVSHTISTAQCRSSCMAMQVHPTVCCRPPGQFKPPQQMRVWGVLTIVVYAARVAAVWNNLQRDLPAVPAVLS